MTTIVFTLFFHTLMGIHLSDRSFASIDAHTSAHYHDELNSIENITEARYVWQAIFANNPSLPSCQFFLSASAGSPPEIPCSDTTVDPIHGNPCQSYAIGWCKDWCDRDTSCNAIRWRGYDARCYKAGMSDAFMSAHSSSNQCDSTNSLNTEVWLMVGKSVTTTATGSSGDPHITNILGESFDVMRTGRMVMLEIPRATNTTTPQRKFALEADIERLGIANCGPTFITKVFFDGDWLDTPVSIRSGPPKQHNFMGIQLGHAGKWILPAAFVLQNNGLMEVQGPNHDDEQAFYLTVDKKVHVKVSQPKRPRTFLDVSVSGMSHVKEEIGGLLGVDDHHAAASLPEECNSQFSARNKYGASAIASL